MNNTHRHCEATSPSIGAVVGRLALPLFLFSFILFFLLFLSWILILPHISGLRLHSNLTSVSALQSYHRSLTQRLRIAEDSREQFIIPVHDPVYQALRVHKFEMPSFLGIAEEVERVQTSVVPAVDQAIVIDGMHFLAKEGTLEMRGRVQHVGPSSMTVLAQFTDALTQSPLIASVENPSFSREENESGFFSPFKIRAALRVSSD